MKVKGKDVRNGTDDKNSATDDYPEKIAIDQKEIRVYAAYVEAKHERQIQKFFLAIILPLYFITIWIAMFLLKDEQYDSTFHSISLLVIVIFLFAFQSKIKAILMKTLGH